MIINLYCWLEFILFELFFMVDTMNPHYSLLTSSGQNPILGPRAGNKYHIKQR